MLPLIGTFTAALLLSVALTYIARSSGLKLGLVDEPDGIRRLHERPIPRIGGLGLVLSVMLVVTFMVPSAAAAEIADQHTFPALLIGAVGVMLLGLTDDVRGLRARTKLAFEIIIALIVYWQGVRIQTIGLTHGAVLNLPSWLSVLLTTAWLVGITNAFNLIDGSDGLTAGAALFGAISLAIASVFTSSPVGTIVAVALAGGTLGFLYFNFPPASVFLGDCGSLFLGFTLAALGIITTQKASTALAIAIPVLCFGLPILDTSLAIIRRFLRGGHIFEADRGHIHHRLRDLGHSPRQVVMLLYGACAVFGLGSLVLIQPSGWLVAIMIIGFAICILAGLHRLGIPEIIELQRVMGRGFRQRIVIAENVRVREAIAMMRAATTVQQLLNSLSFAFNEGEFDRVDLWLDSRHSRLLSGRRDVQARSGGVAWTCTSRLPKQASTALWELKLPFRDEGAHHDAGYLTIGRSVKSQHLFTDVQTIAYEMLPVLQDRLTFLLDSNPSYDGAANGAPSVEGTHTARMMVSPQPDAR